MEQLAAVAHFSRFHFQRQFADFVGVGVARYILLMRLKHASLQLAFQPQRRIIDIALEAGFENPESFTRLQECFRPVAFAVPARARLALLE
jgi:AraC family transcriptional regulator